MRKPRISSWRWRELRKMADSGVCRGPSSGVTRGDMHESSKKRKPKSGICRGSGSGVTHEDIHELTKKQSQSCCPKKSGFWVWTSGRFVNMLDEKDILVCVHTKNIPWAWGCCRYVKVPSSPYKRGHEGTCKRIQTFWNLCNQQRELQSLCTLTVCLNVPRTLSLSLACSGKHPNFLGNPPTAICVFVGSLSLFWTRVYVGERWDSFLSYLFQHALFPFYATRNVHIFVYFIQMVRNLLLAVQEYAFLVSRTNECCWITWLCLVMLKSSN
jgi:hypothetical protein